jgi:hypothetical protein
MHTKLIHQRHDYSDTVIQCISAQTNCVLTESSKQYNNPRENRKLAEKRVTTTEEKKESKTHRLLSSLLPCNTELSTLLPNLSLTDRLVPATGRESASDSCPDLFTTCTTMGTVSESTSNFLCFTLLLLPNRLENK